MMANNIPSGHGNGQPLDTESPRGANPSEDVSCASCGKYRTLYGPVDLDGRRKEGGDMVCRSCLSGRRSDPKQSTDGGYPSIEDLGNDELVRCTNPDYPEVWFYELDDEDVVRYHSSKGYERDTIPTRSEAENSISSPNVETEVVTRSVLKDHRQQTIRSDGGSPITEQASNGSGRSEDESTEGLEAVVVEQPRDEKVADTLNGIVEIPQNGPRVRPGETYDELSASQQAVALLLGQYAAWRYDKKHDVEKQRTNALPISHIMSHTNLTEPEIREHRLLDTAVGCQAVTLDMEDSEAAIDRLRRRNCADANPEGDAHA